MKPHLQLDDGAWWPNPDDDELEWRLRYGRESLTDTDLLVAASYIAGYRHLLTHPQGTEATIRQLRQARRLVRDAE